MNRMLSKISRLFSKKEPVVENPLVDCDFAVFVPACYASMMIGSLGVSYKILEFAGMNDFRWVATDNPELVGIILTEEPTVNDMIAIAHGCFLVSFLAMQMGDAIGVDIATFPPINVDINTNKISEENVRFFKASVERMRNSNNLSRFLVKCGLDKSGEDYE